MDYSSSRRPREKESIVFSGTLDGKFSAYSADSGKILWQYDTGASIVAPSATFTMDNKRYVLVNSGDPLKVPELSLRSVLPISPRSYPACKKPPRRSDAR